MRIIFFLTLVGFILSPQISLAELSDFDKAQGYVSYIQRIDADPKMIAEMLKTVKRFKVEESRAYVYQSYFDGALISADPTITILEDVRSFQSEANKQDVYLAYIENRSDGIDLPIMATIYIESEIFKDEQIKDIIAASYLKRMNNSLIEVNKILFGEE